MKGTSNKPKDRYLFAITMSKPFKTFVPDDQSKNLANYN